MARARKCDRCGRLYEQYLTEGLRGELYKICVITTGNNERNNAENDLCPECMESFIRWFNFNTPREEAEAEDVKK